ncbi:MAG: right-handed parallel beta-helix repeat-containing protein [Planctomycetaceae bacterium]|nr:right-handed parallel beta-helix repeat-containing protein [Planctomycetaceae bacterium]
MSSSACTRRRFLTASAMASTMGLLSRRSLAQLPDVANPRATDGDAQHEPNWDERFTLTVGQESADLVGRDDKVLQAAVDYVARMGGGTVKVLPGTYTLRNSVYLPSKIRLLGSGPETVVTKGPSETLEFADDSDWYDQEITLKNAGGLRVGDGVTLRAKDVSRSGELVIKKTLVARSGNRFKINDGLRQNLWVEGAPTCTSVFPLLTSEYTSDVVIEDLVLDGNRENNAHLDGNYGGCIFLQDCNRYTFRNVEARNNNGDGFSFQICHDVRVENCWSHDHADLGVHPGSGSQRPLISHCKLERNGIGLFWCWGVKYGLAEDNQIRDNRDYGISIGHNDTDNVMRRNEIVGSGKVGLLFRDDGRGLDFWANRNTFENNKIIDTGDDTGVAIDIQGQTKDLKIANNELRETRRPMNRTGIRIGSAAQRIELADNTIEGFANSIVRQG